MSKLKDFIQYTPVRQAFFNLLSGNAVVFLGQLIMLYVILLIYSKEALSQYTLFVAISYLTTKLVNFKLVDCLVREPDMGVVIDYTRHIFTLTILMTAICSIVYWLLIAGGIDFQLFYGEDRMWLFVVFMSYILISSLNLLFATLLLKRDQTKQLSVARIIKVFTQLIFTILFVRSFSFGLIAALLVATIFELVYYVIRSRLPAMKFSRLSDIVEMLKANRDILIYTLPISLLISVHDNLIVQSIEYFYGAGALAIFAVADRVLRIPGQIIGGAANMTLFKYGSDTYHKSPKAYFQQFKRGVGRMSVFFIVAAVSCMLLARPVFTYILNPEWLAASDLLIKYAWWIIPFSLIAILRGVPVMLKQQRAYFFIEVLMVAVLGLSLWFAGDSLDFTTFLEVKFGVELVFYCLMIFAIYLLVRAKSNPSDNLA